MATGVEIDVVVAATGTNPYYSEVVALHGTMERDQYKRLDFERLRAQVDFFSKRYEYVRKYGFAVPTPEALALVARYGPVLEIGAGCGYWAYCLRLMGVDVLAYDKHVPGKGTKPKGVDYGWTFTHAEVRSGNHAAALVDPAARDRTLLIVWPSLYDTWAREALKLYRGDRFIYVRNSTPTGSKKPTRRYSSGWASTTT